MKLPRVVVTSDIGCQYSKHFWQCNQEFPDDLRLDPDTDVDIAIPSWHINGHGPKCKCNFSMSYMVGAGRTCGEEVETSWAHTNSLGMSVHEMGPGARHETLNDHWNAWNFHKIVRFCTSIPFFRHYVVFMMNLGELFLKRFNNAYQMRDKHCDAFCQLSATFPVETVGKWETMVSDWKVDKSKPNPYDEPRSCMFLSIRLSGCVSSRLYHPKLRRSRMSDWHWPKKILLMLLEAQSLHTRPR
jgi:hypothetical protein